MGHDDHGDNDDLDDDVGYGRPPRKYRFRKGVSGNPKGRPPTKRIQQLLESSATDEAMRAELDRMLHITENGKRKRMSVRNVVAKTVIKEAITSNTHALKLVLSYSESLDRRDGERARLARQEQDEDFKIMQKYRQARIRVWGSASGGLAEPNDPWPHPDDILLNHDQLSWRIRGPMGSKELPKYEYFRCERDAVFGQVMLGITGPGEVNEFVTRFQTLSWLTWDRLLPLRWQWWPQFDAKSSELTLHDHKLRSWTREREMEVERLRPLFTAANHEKEVRRKTERLMKPLLEQSGFRSLVEVERSLKTS